jgi:hypothetical protein
MGKTVLAEVRKSGKKSTTESARCSDAALVLLAESSKICAPQLYRRIAICHAWSVVVSRFRMFRTSERLVSGFLDKVFGKPHNLFELSEGAP